MLGLYIRDSLCTRQSSGPHIRDFTRTRQISGLVFWEISCATQFSRPILRISVAPHKFRCRCQGFLKIQHTFRADIRDFSCTIQISGPIRGRQAGRFDRGAYVGLCTVVSLPPHWLTIRAASRFSVTSENGSARYFRFSQCVEFIIT